MRLQSGVYIDDTTTAYRLNQSIPASYVIWKDTAVSPTLYRAESNLYGVDDEANADYDTVLQACVDALEGANGGRIHHRRGLYNSDSACTVDAGVPIVISGDVCHYDRFYSAVNDPGQGTVIYSNDSDLFTVGGSTLANAPLFYLKDIAIVGKDPSTEPIGDDSQYSAGKAVKLTNNVKYCKLENVHIHRKEYAVYANAGSGNEICRVDLNRVSMSYNLWGFYNDAYILRYLHIKELEGYLNQYSLIKANPTYDCVLENIDDEASGWNGTDAATTHCPIYLATATDLHIKGMSVVGSKGTTPNPTAYLAYIYIGDYGYAEIEDIYLCGGNYNGLGLVGSASEFDFFLHDFYIGKNPNESYGFRGETDSLDVGIKIANAAYGVIHDGKVWATSKIQNNSTGMVLGDIQQLSPSSLDLSGAATDLNTWYSPTDAVLLGYQLQYTEASSADAGVAVDVGRYQDGVALDDDYFDTSTSEVSKNLGYSKNFVYSDLSNSEIDAGDSVTVGTAGGKVGTGEIRVTLNIVRV